MSSIDLNLSYVAPDHEDDVSNGSDDDLVDVVSEEATDTATDLQTAIRDLEDLDSDEEEDSPPAGPVPAAPVPTTPVPAATVAKPAGGVRRKWTLLQKLRILKRYDSGEKKRAICVKEKIDKKVLNDWIEKRQDLLAAAKQAIRNGRKLKDRCRIKSGGVATKYGALDVDLWSWWQVTKQRNKERVTKMRLLQQAEELAQKHSLPATFQAVFWVERFMQPGRQ